MEYIVTKEISAGVIGKRQDESVIIAKGTIVHRAKRLSKIKLTSVFQYNNYDVILKHEDIMAHKKCDKTNIL